jgi:protein O-GlcNAc transferase
LPHGRYCYSPPDYAPLPVDPPALRRGFVTLGSFNNIAKIGAAVVQLWAEVLYAIPNSLLLLKCPSLDDQSTRRRFGNAFMAAGIAPGRLELEGASRHSELLARYNEVDIALDPFPYSGCTTTYEAFWMGVPVVTFPGDRSASRQVLQCFDYTGLGDCVARSPRDYVERARALARDPTRLTALRLGIRALLAESPLCDGKRFAAALEWAYQEMWRRWCWNRPPTSFDIPPQMVAQSTADVEGSPAPDKKFHQQC